MYQMKHTLYSHRIPTYLGWILIQLEILGVRKHEVNFVLGIFIKYESRNFILIAGTRIRTV